MNMKMNWNPDHKELRKFGGVIIVGFGMIGAIVYNQGKHTPAEWIWGISSAIGLWSLLFPSLSKPFYWLWMGFGVMMGKIVSPVVMGIIFYGILTPVALIFRGMKRDPLRLDKKTITGNSYWLEHSDMTNKKGYEHLF